MPRIQKLSIQEAQKIAAGEVVERPANVVKELIENSIDAGATVITVYLENGGKDLIRIVDNGCGMDAQDARLCIEQYATSKITSISDLTTLNTFGFRGEALASVCAVGKVALATKESESMAGIHLEIADGAILSEAPIACTTGTDITIADLFYNVPARRKFLKSRETEVHQIQMIMQAFCFVYHHITFKLFHDGKLIYNCPAAQDILTRFAQLWDLNHASHMLPIAAAQKGITLNGAISLPKIARYDRSHIFCFVNNRWVKNTALSKAIIKGYMNVLPPARFPAACISITIDQAELDVNIHPRKEEIQFMHPRIVEGLLTSTVKSKLEEHLTKQLSSYKETVITNQASAVFSKVEPSWQGSIATPSYAPAPNFKPFEQLPEQSAKIEAGYRDTQPFIVQTVKPTPSPAVEEIALQEMVTQLPELHASNLIGQLKKTYLLLEHEQGMFLVDQHAAHERILYEQFASRFHEIPTIKLLFAHTVHLTSQDLVLLLPHLNIFEQHGIGIEPVSSNQVVVQSLPIHLNNKPIDDLIKMVIGWLQESHDLNEQDLIKQIHEKLRAQMACKAAVKAGDILTREQMEKLLTDLMVCNNRFTCPHGRPTGWLLSTNEIEKKFKRKL